MSLIASVSIAAAEFPVGRALATDGRTRFELEALVPTREHLLPFFWAHGDDVESVVDRVTAPAEIGEIAVVDRFDDSALFRLEWQPTDGLVAGIGATEVVLLEATGADGEWTFELRAEQRCQFADFREYCDEHDLPIELDHLSTLTETPTDRRYGLTDKQRRTLLALYEDGYFEEPRESTLGDVAEEFDISRKALSQRFRRGVGRLVGETVASKSRL